MGCAINLAKCLNKCKDNDQACYHRCYKDFSDCKKGGIIVIERLSRARTPAKALAALRVLRKIEDLPPSLAKRFDQIGRRIKRASKKRPSLRK